MTSTYGKIDAFDECQGETWEHYTERLGQYFEANGIGDTTAEDKIRRRAILLSVCGPKVYKLISDLLAPTKPSEKTYGDLVTLLREHFSPKPSEIVERYKFHNRFRKTGESVSQYIAALRNVSEHCNFGQTLDVMIRDRLVCGIRDDRRQRRLLSEHELTFTKAYEIAISMETAAKNVFDLHKEDTPSKENIHKLSQSKQGQKAQTQSRGQRSHPEGHNKGQSIKPCFRCGGKHNPHNCKFKDSECFYCHEKGHILEKCLSRLADNNKASGGQSTVRKKSSNRVNVLDSCNEDEDDDIYPMYRISSQNKAPYLVTVSVNGSPLKMEIDTGASKTVMGESTFELLNKNKNVALKQSNTKLKTYTGEIVPVLGSCEVPVSYGKYSGILSAEVIKGDNPCLLGRDWLQHIKLNWNDIFTIRQESNCQQIEEILDKYPSVFEPGLGKVVGTKAKKLCGPE